MKFHNYYMQHFVMIYRKVLHFFILSKGTTIIIVYKI